MKSLFRYALRLASLTIFLMSISGCDTTPENYSDPNLPLHLYGHSSAEQPSTISRLPLPMNISSLLIVSQTGQEQPSWFGPDYQNFGDFVDSAASEVLGKAGFEIVTPREYLRDLEQEIQFSHEEISNHQALSIGKQHSATGVLILDIHILEDSRIRPQGDASRHDKRSQIFLCYYRAGLRPFYPTYYPNNTYTNSNNRSVSAQQKQPFVQVNVAARVLDVEAGTVVRTETGTFEYWSPSSVESVVQEAVKSIAGRFYRNSSQ